MGTSLEDRLMGLELNLPERLVARASTAAARPRKRATGVAIVRPVVIGTLSVGAFVGINAVAGRVWPAYGRVLADVPGAQIVPGWLDPRTGLVPRTTTPLNASATSAGHEVRLIGGSADAARTLLFFEIDGKSYSDIQDPPAFQVGAATLTDSEGNTYKQLSYGHNFVPAFEPLKGAAASGGSLTLHVSELWPRDPGGQLVADRDHAIAGDWTVRFSLVAQPGVEIAIPAPAVAEGIRYDIVSVHGSGDVIEFQWRASGDLVSRVIAELGAAPPMFQEPSATPGGQATELTPEFKEYARRQSAFSHEHFDVSVIGPSGALLVPFAGGLDVRDGAANGQVTMLTAGPGRYVIRFGTIAETVIDIP